MEQDLKAVWCVNGFAAGKDFVVDVTQPTFKVLTVFGYETYYIKPGMGEEGYHAVVDENVMPKWINQ